MSWKIPLQSPMASGVMMDSEIIESVRVSKTLARLLYFDFLLFTVEFIIYSISIQ